MSRLSSLPILAALFVVAFLAAQAEGRAFFGSLFQDAQLNNGTAPAGLGALGGLLEALAAFHESHSLTDLFNVGK